MFPIHLTNNPTVISPQSRKKYPDKRRILPMYRNTSDFAIKGFAPDQCCYSPSVTSYEIREAKLPGLAFGASSTFGVSTLTSSLTSGLGEDVNEVFATEVFLVIVPNRL
jgi:hypothetical protein